MTATAGGDPARVAIVGGGPAGFFLADALSRQAGLAIDLLERLPFPFGLVRYGVAPDHQGTKAVTRTFARVMAREGVRYLGGVEVGRDLSLAELRRHADAVVLATGAVAGRRVAFSGADSPRSVTAFDLARWINAHPDAPQPALPPRAETVVVLGHGNVALDMARLLAAGPSRLESSDASPAFLRWLESQRLRRILLCGRGGPDRTRFSPDMLAELARLPGVSLVRACESPIAEKGEEAAALIAALPAQSAAGTVAVELHFERRPLVIDDGRLEFAGPDGKRQCVPADLVIHAIGQDTVGEAGAALDGLPLDPAGDGIANRDGAVEGEERLFVLGWVAGHARGTIPDSRVAARCLAPVVAATASAAAAERREPLPDLWKLLATRDVAVTDWEAWTALDRLELEEGAAVGACRRKLLRLPEGAGAQGR